MCLMRRGYAEVMQKTGIEKMLFGGEARLLSGRGKKRREGKSARKNKWSAGESGTSGWSGQRARASMMGDVSGQFEGNRSTESSESGSEVGFPRSARRARGKILLCGTCPAACTAFPGDEREFRRAKPDSTRGLRRDEQQHQHQQPGASSTA